MKAIKHHRAKNNIPSSDLAEKAGITPSTIRSIESGRIQTPSPAVLESIALALDIPLPVLEHQADLGRAKRKNNPNLFGSWLKHERTTRGISVSGMALALGITSDTYRSIESGRILSPPPMRLAALAEYLHMPISMISNLVRHSAAIASATLMFLSPADAHLLLGHESGGLPVSEQMSLPGFDEERPTANPETLSVRDSQAYRLALKKHYPLDLKIAMSKKRIEQWYSYHCGKVFVSFSGGKDSTVLLHLVRSLYPDVPAVFVAPPEYKETFDYIRDIPNLIILKPFRTFEEVIGEKGYPVLSKDQATAIERYRNTKDEMQKQYRIHGFPNGKKGKIADKNIRYVNAPFKISGSCCDLMKKGPLVKFQETSGLAPFVATMASESMLREDSYLKHGCNAYDQLHPQSRPMMFWTDSDVWQYIRQNKLPYNPIYDMGETRSGCRFCLFGIEHDSTPNRFQRMKQHHPKDWKYAMDKLGYREILEYMHIPAEDNQMAMNF